MSSISNITSLGGDYLLLGQGSDSTNDFNIITNDGRAILLNGIDPTSGAGGGGLPINAPGNITLNPGNLKANGDGSTTGLIEGENIKSKGNLIVEGSLNLAGGLSGINIASNGALTMNTGNISQNGGNFTQSGAGKITAGTNGITSNGEIQTVGTHDIVAGRNFYFDGTDIFKREVSGFPPVVTEKNYKDYKGLVGKNDANIFTGANQFNSNTTEFAAKVSVGTRDPQSLLFTQNLALNTSGNIECKTINNGTIIQTGNINCGNGGQNEVRARVFKTRTNEQSSPEGWTIEQQTPSNPAQPFDRSLTFKGGEANAFISILDSAHSGFFPNITLDPRTTALGGLISATTHQVGQGIEAYTLEQPNSGSDADNLLIKAGSGGGVVKFQNNTGTIDLLQIEEEAGSNDGMLRVPKIEFGLSGNRNRIYNLQSGPTNLNLNIQHASASSEVVFQDNQEGEIMIVKKTEIVLGDTIRIDFGSYGFRPIEITYAFTGAELDSNPATLFNSATTDFIRTNDGATVKLNDLGEAVYILSIDSTSSSGGTIGSSRFMCNFPYMVSANAAGSFSFSGNFCMNTTPPNNFITPTIDGDGTSGPVGSTDYSLVFPSKNTTETYNGIVRITRLSY